MDKDSLVIGGILAAILGTGFFGTAICNRQLNEREITTDSYHQYSTTKKLLGHQDYIRYADGSREVVVAGPNSPYTGLTHLIDSNGDGIVEKIFKHGPPFATMMRTNILIRAEDYRTHQKDFDDADELLRKMMLEYESEESYESR